MSKVLRNGLLRYILHTCPNLWCNSCSNCNGMDCFGTCFKIVQSCNVIISLVRHISRYSSISLVINITILYSPSFCARSWCFICILWWRKRPRRIDPKVPHHGGGGGGSEPRTGIIYARQSVFWEIKREFSTVRHATLLWMHADQYIRVGQSWTVSFRNRSKRHPIQGFGLQVARWQWGCTWW